MAGKFLGLIVTCCAVATAVAAYSQTGSSFRFEPAAIYAYNKERFELIEQGRYRDALKLAESEARKRQGDCLAGNAGACAWVEGTLTDAARLASALGDQSKAAAHLESAIGYAPRHGNFGPPGPRVAQYRTKLALLRSGQPVENLQSLKQAAASELRVSKSRAEAASAGNAGSGVGEASQCLRIKRDPKTNSSARVVNSCSYPVHFAFCWRNVPADSWAKAMLCSNNKFGSAEAPPNGWAGVTSARAGNIHFAGCKGPSLPVDLRWRGDQIGYRCTNSGSAMASSKATKPLSVCEQVVQRERNYIDNIAPRQSLYGNMRVCHTALWAAQDRTKAACGYTDNYIQTLVHPNPEC